MQLHADLTQRAVVQSTALDWIPSPMPGVDRRMLDRNGEEVARATSIVRYAPESFFSAHSHGGGEEFFVLDGVFSDENGDYSKGTYVRNPVGSRHTPFSKEGGTIFVKLHQFDPDDQASVRIDTTCEQWRPGIVDGITVMPLHQFRGESVSLVNWAAGVVFPEHQHPNGEEILVLKGQLIDEQGCYDEGTWIRNPPGSHHRPFSEKGCVLYVKTGHLGQQ